MLSASQANASRTDSMVRRGTGLRGSFRFVQLFHYSTHAHFSKRNFDDIVYGKTFSSWPLRSFVSLCGTFSIAMVVACCPKDDFDDDVGSFWQQRKGLGTTKKKRKEEGGRGGREGEEKTTTTTSLALKPPNIIKVTKYNII